MDVEYYFTFAEVNGVPEEGKIFAASDTCDVSALKQRVEARTGMFCYGPHDTAEEARRRLDSFMGRETGTKAH